MYASTTAAGDTMAADCGCTRSIGIHTPRHEQQHREPSATTLAEQPHSLPHQHGVHLHGHIVPVVHIPIRLRVFIADWCLPCTQLVDAYKQHVQSWCQTTIVSRRTASTIICIYVLGTDWVNVSNSISDMYRYGVQDVPTMLLVDTTANDTVLPYTVHVGVPSNVQMLQYLLDTWERALVRRLELEINSRQCRPMC